MPSVTNIGTAGGKGATTQTITATTPAGALIVVVTGEVGAIAGFTVSDPVNGTYNSAVASTTNNALATIWYVFNAGALSSQSISVGSATAGTFEASAFYATGVQTASNPLDATGSATGTSTAPSVSTSAGTAATGELIVGAVATNGPSGDTFTQDSTHEGGFSTPPTRVGTTGGGATSNETIAGGTVATWSSSGTATYAPTLGTSRLWGAVIATFKAAPAASPFVPYRWPSSHNEDASYWVGSPLAAKSLQDITLLPKTVVRPPLFVPGPPGEVPWLSTAERNEALLSPAQNPFVAPPWRDDYDAAAVWQGTPLPSGAIVATTTQTKYYGQPGQVPPFRPNFTYDDPPPWYPLIDNLNSWTVLHTVTNPFVAPPRRDDYDAAAVWQGEPQSSQNLLLLLAAINLPMAPLYAPRPVSEEIWVRSSTGVGTLRMPTQSPFAPQVQWFSAYGEIAPWQWSSERNLSLLTPTTPLVRYSYQWYSEDTFWQWPSDPSAIMQILSSQKIFGQGGQVPPYRPITAYDDASTWAWSPSRDTVLLQTATPLFSWRPYWYSEDAAWQGVPLGSFSISLTTTQTKYYGQPGQVVPFRWNWTLDDPPTWRWTMAERNLNVLAQSILLPMASMYAPRPASEEIWVGVPAGVGTIRTSIHNPFAFQLQWPYTHDATATWTWTPSRDTALLQIGTPVFNWKPSWYSEDAFWQGTPAASSSIPLTTTQTKYYGQPGQVVPFRPNFTYDDPPTWRWTMAERNLNVLMPLILLPIAPVYAPRPASEEIWVGSSVSAGVTRLPTTNPFFKSWSAYLVNDDPSVWQWPPMARNRNVLIPTVTPLVHAPYQWYSEDALWQASSVPANIEVLLAFELYKPGLAYGLGTDDPATWGSAPPHNFVLLFPTGTPFQNWKPYLYSEDALWQGSPLVSQPVTLTTTQAKYYGQSGQVPPFRWNATYDDSSLWTWPSQAWNKNALTQVVNPLVRPPTKWFSEDAFWQGAPAPSYSVTLTTTQTRYFGQPGQVPPFRWNATYDDSSLWTWPGATRNRNVLLPTIPPLVYPPAQWYSEDAFWQGSPQTSRAVALTTTQSRYYGQPGQVLPFRWNWTQDDPPPHRQTTPNAAVIDLLTAAQLPGLAPGAAPARFYKFDYDESSTWWPKNRLVVTLIFPIVVPPPGPAARVVSARTSVGAVTSSTLVEGLFSVTTVGTEISSTTVGGTEFGF